MLRHQAQVVSVDGDHEIWELIEALLRRSIAGRGKLSVVVDSVRLSRPVL